MLNFKWHKEQGSFKRNKNVDGVKISRVMIENIEEILIRMKKSTDYDVLLRYEYELKGYLRALYSTGAINKEIYDRYFRLMLDVSSRKTYEIFDIKKRIW